jgi:uncharacterized protein with NRDE domain
VCLLVVSFRQERGFALVVAANRDERYDRPSSPVALRGLSPRVLAGRDEEAGGTWLALNEHGVVAGLTNQPSPHGHDPTLRSRGALPLLAARHKSAADAAAALVEQVDPRQYNPCSLLIGDRQMLFSIELQPKLPVRARLLEPGRYVLENCPLGTDSAKVRHVESQLQGIGASLGQDSLFVALTGILADHRLPEGAGTHTRALGRQVACCVHGRDYGTRSSLVVFVDDDAKRLPTVFSAEGPPCTAPFLDCSPLWSGAVPCEESPSSPRGC